MMDLHTALATPTALRWAQVTGPVEFPDSSDGRGGRGRRADGRVARGRARRTSCCAPGRALRWPELRARHVEILGELNALGLTGAHVMDGDPGTLELLRDLEGTDELSMRLRIPQWITPELDDAAIEERIKLRDARGKLWSGGVAKFFADGVIDAGTAWLEAPDTHGEGLTPFWPDPERMAAVMTRFAERGLPARDAHDRRRRRALHARRLHPRGRGGRRPPSARAPGSAPGRPRAGRSPARAWSPRCSPCT